MATDFIIKEAVKAQILSVIEQKNISKTWLTDTLTKTLGIKKEKGKRVPLTKRQIIESLKIGISSALNHMGDTMTLKEIKEFIKCGSDELLTLTIQETATTRLVEAPTQEQVKADIEHMLSHLTLEQSWAFLSACNTWNGKEYYEKAAAKQAKKTTTPVKKSNYITCTNEEAVQILAPYYNQLASGTNSIPECFKSSANATQAFQRFVFSHMNQADCGVTNSLNESVYTAWKDANKDVTLTSEELERKQAVIDGYKAANPDYMDTLKGWSNRPYIKCLLKKDEVKQEKA